MNVKKNIVFLSYIIVTFAHASVLEQSDALRLRREGVIQPLDFLMTQVSKRYPKSTLLEINLTQRNKDFFQCQIELLTRKDEVRILQVNARTGELLDDQVDH